MNMFQDLDSPVSEGGENFSAGEKQLMWCVGENDIQTVAETYSYSMARAILKRSKILFCDEGKLSPVMCVNQELILFHLKLLQGWAILAVRSQDLTFSSYSVDYATDELISQTIRKEFVNSTIVTV